MAGGRHFGGRRARSTGLPRPGVPDDVVARAKTAFGRRIVGGVLAELVSDSLDDEPSHRRDRRLQFRYGSGRVEIVVTRTDGDYRVSGVVHPAPERAELEVEGHDVAIIQTASSGSFTFEHVPPAVVRIRLVGAFGAPVVHTDWFRLAYTNGG